MEKSNFLKNIYECYVTEELREKEMERICDDIIEAVKAPLSDYSKLMKELDDCIRNSTETFKLQQKDLENFSLR